LAIGRLNLYRLAVVNKLLVNVTIPKTQLRIVSLEEVGTVFRVLSLVCGSADKPSPTRVSLLNDPHWLLPPLPRRPRAVGNYGPRHP
jgi:hypothetical protein